MQHLTTLSPEVRRYREALETLKDFPTAELERVFSETLDVCSHRIDAWVTSLFSKRLEDMRKDQSEYCYLGAYGWVEDLKPDPDSRRQLKMANGKIVTVFSDSAGYVQAPSMSHGNAAAVLRNGYWTRRGEHKDPYAINLSSARVRTALWILDSIREGQPLGAVLGYRFERGLHEGHTGVELDKFIDDFRRKISLGGK